MTDEMPYEKAIEETAKTVGKAIDAVRDGSRALAPTIGDIYGILIGDKVSAARTRRLDEITRETKRILQDRNVKEQQELPEDIAIPLLEAAQGEPRKEMQKLWAQLLANAMDPSRAGDVRPEFIETLKQLQTLDALLLEAARVALEVKENNVEGWLAPAYAERTKHHRKSALSLSMNHLLKLSCITMNGLETMRLSE